VAIARLDWLHPEGGSIVGDLFTAPHLIFLCILFFVGTPCTFGVLLIPPFWKIFERVGYAPVLSVLMLVPVVNLVLIYVVAFSARPLPASAVQMSPQV
jgi:hypothetical protein